MSKAMTCVEVFALDSFKALCSDIGIDLSKEITSLTIELPSCDRLVSIKIEHTAVATEGKQQDEYRKI